jgi:hypothetical protein
MRVSLAIAALLAMPSCARETVVTEAGSTDPCMPGPNPSLEIGQGEFEYEPLEAGGTIELIHGPQGGFHTLTGLLARDIDASEQLTAELRGYVGDEQVGGSFPYVNFRCAGDAGSEAWAVYLFWERPPEQLHMQTVRIEVELTDADGTVVQASKEAVIHDPTLQ